MQVILLLGGGGDVQILSELGKGLSRQRLLLWRRNFGILYGYVVYNFNSYHLFWWSFWRCTQQLVSSKVCEAWQWSENHLLFSCFLDIR